METLLKKTPGPVVTEEQAEQTIKSLKLRAGDLDNLTTRLHVYSMRMQNETNPEKLAEMEKIHAAMVRARLIRNEGYDGE